MADIQAKSSRLEVVNSHLASAQQQCERNRSEAVAEAAKQLQLKQKAHDDQVDYICVCVGGKWEPRERSMEQADFLHICYKTVTATVKMYNNLLLFYVF